MNTCLVTLAAAIALSAIAPPLGADDGPKPDIPGYLMPDISCSEAAYVLLSPCPPNAAFAYVAFPQGRDVDRFVGRLVAVRGEVDLASTCSRPLVKAARITDNPILPPCPPPYCDFPPCP